MKNAVIFLALGLMVSTGARAEFPWGIQYPVNPVPVPRVSCELTSTNAPKLGGARLIDLDAKKPQFPQRVFVDLEINVPGIVESNGFTGSASFREACAASGPCRGYELEFSLTKGQVSASSPLNVISDEGYGRQIVQLNIENESATMICQINQF